MKGWYIDTMVDYDKDREAAKIPCLKKEKIKEKHGRKGRRKGRREGEREGGSKGRKVTFYHTSLGRLHLLRPH